MPCHRPPRTVAAATTTSRHVKGMPQPESVGTTTTEASVSGSSLNDVWMKPSEVAHDLPAVVDVPGHVQHPSFQAGHDERLEVVHARSVVQEGDDAERDRAVVRETDDVSEVVDADRGAALAGKRAQVAAPYRQ